MTDIPANFRPGAFRGTAEAYAQYRPPYPRALIDDLLAQVRTGPGTTLLDLATGPGRIALDLAPRFERVVAMDLEPEMIEVARNRAKARGLANITWSVGRAEDLELPTGSIDLITIGEAFHRLDQRLIARKAFEWLRPGGALATLGHFGHFIGDEPWERKLVEVRDRWLARAFPGGYGNALPGAAEGPDARAALLRDAGFVDVTVHPLAERMTWTVDTLLGYLASTSVCSAAALGADFEPWAADLRSTLAEDATSTFEETVSWDYMLARKSA